MSLRNSLTVSLKNTPLLYCSEKNLIFPEIFQITLKSVLLVCFFFFPHISGVLKELMEARAEPPVCGEQNYRGTELAEQLWQRAEHLLGLTRP